MTTAAVIFLLVFAVVYHLAGGYRGILGLLRRRRK